MTGSGGAGQRGDGVEIEALLRSGSARRCAEGLRIVSPRTGRPLLLMAMTDLDGTANDEHVVESDRADTIGPARAAFAILTESGLVTGICTARSTGEAMEYREQLGISGPVIAENGAVIRHPDGTESVPGDPLELRRALERIEAALGRSVPSSLGPAALEALWQREQAGENPVELGHASLGALRRAMDRRASCFLVGLTADEKRTARSVASGLGLDSFGQLLHLIPSGADKGTALSELLHRLERQGAARAEGWLDVVPVVFGNGENDLPLFAEALRRGGAAVLVGDGRSEHGFHFDPAVHAIPVGTICLPGRSHGHGILASLPLLAREIEARHGIRFPWGAS